MFIYPTQVLTAKLFRLTVDHHCPSYEATTGRRGSGLMSGAVQPQVHVNIGIDLAR